jgi:hypothetical protein
MEQVEAVLVKKEEGRPVTPEEYQVLTAFVDRVQREIESQRDEERLVLKEKLEAVRSTFPKTAYEVALEDVGLSTRVFNLLSEAGYETAGVVLETLGLDEDAILGLQGVGPKAVEEIKQTLTAFEYPEIEEEPEPEVEEAEPEEVEAEAPVEEAVAEAEPDVVEEVEVEKPSDVEIEPEPALEEVTEDAEPVLAEAPAVEAETVAETIEESFEDLIDQFTEALEIDEFEDEVEMDPEEKAKRERRKGKARVVEYDPDLDEMVVRRRRKREDDEDWDSSSY